MQSSQTPPKLQYASGPRPTRTSRLAIGALILSVLSCPVITLGFTQGLLGELERFTHIWIPGVPIFNVLILSFACSIGALIRIFASGGRVKGLSMAWTALAVTGFWVVAGIAVVYLAVSRIH